MHILQAKGLRWAAQPTGALHADEGALPGTCVPSPSAPMSEAAARRIGATVRQE
jgi:hypothetical protein